MLPVLQYGRFSFVCLISDVTEVMGDQTGDQTDAELQNKGLGCIYDIDGIEKVADGHADGAADAAPETARISAPRTQTALPRWMLVASPPGSGILICKK